MDQFTLTDRPAEVSEQCSPNTHTEEEEEEEEEGKGQTWLKVNIEKESRPEYPIVAKDLFLMLIYYINLDILTHIK